MLPKQKGNDMRTADAKGRVTLGDKFANRAVIIRVVDETEVIVTLARVIPEREAWLYDNAGAKAAVFEGIEEARNGKVVDGPDMAAADALVNAIEDEEGRGDDVQGEVDAACAETV